MEREDTAVGWWNFRRRSQCSLLIVLSSILLNEGGPSLGGGQDIREHAYLRELESIPDGLFQPVA